MNELRITLKTLTPIWTGGVDGTCDRLHETGLIGSLRWWYEAIVRGLGGYACDPTEHSCTFDEEKYHKSKASDERQRLRDAGICDACQLFGCTGWARRFRLQVIDQGRPAWEDNRSLNVKPYGRTRGWFLYPGRVGRVTLVLTGEEQALSQLLALFRFLEAWGSLGPRPQLGYGIFHITQVSGALQSFSWSPLGDRPTGSPPDLRAFTFFKFRFIPAEQDWWGQVSGLPPLRGRPEWAIVQSLAMDGMVPVMPALKNYLRFEQRWPDVVLPHWLFGTLRKDERVRSRVALSWAYRLPDKEDWEVRGWVHLPDNSRGRAFRPEVVRVLDMVLPNPGQWQSAMGLSVPFRSAMVTYAPSPKPWQRVGQAAIARFLNSFASEAIS